MSGFLHDAERKTRLGLSEAIFCAAKTAGQIEAILDALDVREPLLLTRLEAEKFAALPGRLQAQLDYDAVSQTAIRANAPPVGAPSVAIVSGGTSDAPVAREALRCLGFHGHAATLIEDVGVAGLWRLLEQKERIERHSVVIAVAGMEGALFSVLAGLIAAPIIAVPTSTGYGVTAGGTTALHSALGSCAPGLTVVNIDNGYGAACAAIRILRMGQK